MTVFEEVVELINLIFDFDPDEVVSPEYHLVDDLQFTEEETEELRISLNETFGLSIGADEMRLLETIGDITDYAAKKRSRF